MYAVLFESPGAIANLAAVLQFYLARGKEILHPYTGIKVLLVRKVYAQSSSSISDPAFRKLRGSQKNLLNNILATV
jgi:hypothetical protein